MFQIKIITGVLIIIGAIQAEVPVLDLFDALPSVTGPKASPEAEVADGEFVIGTNWRVVKKFPGPKCPPEFVGAPPNCTAIEYILEEIPVKLCPPGTYGAYPNCHEPCPPFHIGLFPDCQRARCPPGSEGEYQPDCKYPVCADGTTGFYPNCFNFTINPGNGTYIPCPDGEVGTPPFCHIPCPPFSKYICIIVIKRTKREKYRRKNVFVCYECDLK